MAYPPLVIYITEQEYKNHYERVYCSGPIQTFDGIKVWFRKGKFGHCFYESSKHDDKKDVFSKKRAKRINWIKKALQDPSGFLYCGWDKKRKRFDKRRRVALVQGDYVVIIAFKSKVEADFITAFIADTPHTLCQVRGSPRWV